MSKDGYNILRDHGMTVMDTNRMATIVPPVSEKPLTDAERAVIQASWRKRNRKRILYNTILITVTLIIGFGLAIQGGWFFVWKLQCGGLNILWGFLCGLGMTYTILGFYKQNWEI